MKIINIKKTESWCCCGWCKATSWSLVQLPRVFWPSTTVVVLIVFWGAAPKRMNERGPQNVATVCPPKIYKPYLATVVYVYILVYSHFSSREKALTFEVKWTHSEQRSGSLLFLPYRQPGLLCTPQNFAQISKFLGKKHIFWYYGYLWGIFKHFPKFEGHTSSGRHKNETLNLLTKLWYFKVIWTFLGACSWLCCAAVDGLTENAVKQNM